MIISTVKNLMLNEDTFFIISPNEFPPINFLGLIEETPIQTVPDSVSKRATRENEIENKQTKNNYRKKEFFYRR